MSDELLKLAERCEHPAGPDRELDIAILRLRDPKRVEYMNHEYAKGVAELIGRGGDAWEKRKESLYSHCYTPPRYTASLDAAMTLLEPMRNGRWPQLEYIGPNPNNNANGHRVKLWTKGGRYEHGQHQTSFALAICAAALRALASEQSNG